MVSSATFAAFSKPVMAKNARATPATIAKMGLPSTVNDVSTPKSASPRTTTITPMPITSTRPKTSTKVMTMSTSTRGDADEVHDGQERDEQSVTSSADTTSKKEPKQRAKPVASDPDAASTADKEQMVMRKVRTGLRKALLTYSEAPAALELGRQLGVGQSRDRHSVTSAANAIQKAPPAAPATRPMRT